jgi:hypothetical protein
MTGNDAMGLSAIMIVPDIADCEVPLLPDIVPISAKMPSD